MQDRYYAPSGGLSVAAFITVPLLGLIAAAILAYGYAYLSVYNPFIYVTALATMAFGAGVGLAAGLGARLGKVRSPKLMALALLILSAVALYGTWVVWMHAFLGRGDLDIWLWKPDELWAAISLVASQGAWSISSYTPTGVVLYIAWGAEALLLVGFIFFLGFGQAYEPFCERCDVWMDEEELGAFPGVSDPAALVSEIESGALEALSQGDGEGAPLVATLHECPGCQRVGTLTVKAVTVTVNKKGEEETNTEDIMEHFKLDEDSIGRLKALQTA